MKKDTIICILFIIVFLLLAFLSFLWQSIKKDTQHSLLSTNQLRQVLNKCKLSTSFFCKFAYT